MIARRSYSPDETAMDTTAEALGRASALCSALPHSQGVLAHERVGKPVAHEHRGARLLGSTGCHPSMRNNDTGSCAMTVGPPGCGFAEIAGPPTPVLASPKGPVRKLLQLLGGIQWTRPSPPRSPG